MWRKVMNLPMTKQKSKTTCWISAAHFVLQYCMESIPFDKVYSQWVNTPGAGVGQMKGAGKPGTILDSDLYKETKRKSKIMLADNHSKRDVIAAVAASLADGVPVIAGIESQQIIDWSHAIVIIGMDDSTGKLKYIDPAQQDKTFMVEYDNFVGGFLYKEATDDSCAVFAFCKSFNIYRKVAVTAP